MTTACITVRLDEHKLAAAINPNRNEAIMNLEVGKTYRKTDPDWSDAVSATELAKVEAWWKYASGVETGVRGRVSRDEDGELCVPTGDGLTFHYLLLEEAPSAYLTEFTVLELPDRLDPARALVVRNRHGDLWARTGDVWRPLTGPGRCRDFDLDSPPTYGGPLSVVIDADGNVVDEDDR